MTGTHSNILHIIEQARAGDPNSLGQLLEHYRSWLTMMAQRKLPLGLQKRADASDVVQQTFLEAHRDFAAFRGGAEQEFSTWLERILQHNIAEVVRRHALADKRAIHRERPLAGPTGDTTSVWTPASDISTPSQRAMRGERAVELARVLDTLPADQREAVRLRHLEGWPLAKIAEHLNRTPAAAASLIKRGMQTLRKKLSD